MERGKAFLLKISDGATPPVYRTLAGLRTVSETLTPESAAIRANGIFIGSDAANTIRGHALDGTPIDLQLSYEDGLKLVGHFLMTRLDYAGDFNGEPNYTLDFASVGPVVSA